MRHRFAAAAGVLALHAVLVAWLTWPLLPNAATHIANTNRECRYDSLYMVAVLAHESRALLEEPSRFLDLNVYHPASGTLFYGDTGFALLPYFFPTFALTGNPTLAINLAWLACVALTAWSLHLVVRRWTGSHLAGFAAAWVFLVTPWVLSTFLPTAPSYSVLQYLPWIVLLAATPAASFTAGLRLLPLVVLQCLADVAYVAPAVLAPLGILAVVRIVRPATRAAGLRLAAVLVLAVLLLSPVYVGHLAVSLEIPDIRRHSIWWTGSSVNQLSPTILPWGPFQTSAAAVPYAAWGLIVLGVVSFVWRARQRDVDVETRPWAHAALWSLVGLALSITPTARWNGELVRLPHAVLELWTPLYELIRVPNRLAVSSLVGLSLLAGLAFAECALRTKHAVRGTLGTRLVTGALAIALVIAVYATPPGKSSVHGPYPIARAIDASSPIARYLAQPGGALVELPVGRLEQVDSPKLARIFDFDAPIQHARAMYRSIFHDRPLLNGYSGYWPPEFPGRMELVRRLPDPEAVATLRAETGLELILVHTQELGRSEREGCKTVLRRKRPKECTRPFGASERAAWLLLADEGGRPDLRLVARDGGDLLFEVAPAS